MVLLTPMLRFSHLPTHFRYTKLRFCSSSSQFSPWSGLQSWRESPLNEDRFWGTSGPQPLSNTEVLNTPAALEASGSSLAELGSLVLSTSDPLTKSKLSHLAFSRWRNEGLPIGLCQPPSRPARPTNPQLVCFPFKL